MRRFRSGREPTGLNWFVHNFENALARGASGLNQLIELMQFANRFVKKTGQHQKRDKVAELHRAAQHVTCPDRTR